MKPDIVVDVGNTRIKWGLCSAVNIEQIASLSPDDAHEWTNQVQTWYAASHPRWVVSGVHLARRAAFMAWAEGRGDQVTLVDNHRQVPLQVIVDQPERVGIDRLLNGVAARRLQQKGRPCIIVDAGSAVTVDVLDGQGVFRGGAIMPGLRLMAQALHDHTDALPLVPVKHLLPPVPATSTETAIEAGVLWSVAGGIHALCERLIEDWGNDEDADLYSTGGDSLALEQAVDWLSLSGSRPWSRVPEMTLLGLLITAEELP
jgi:type III pantothenate kinase